MTLRLRIVVLVILFAVFLIAGFTAIQVYNQLQMLNQYNAYRVRVGSSSSKTSLEFVLAVQSAQRPTDNPVAALQTELQRLQQGGLFDDVALLTLEGRQLAGGATPMSLDAQDGRWAPHAASVYSRDQWNHTTVTPAAVHVFVPLILQQKPKYVARFTYTLANVQQAMQGVYRLSVLMIAGVVGLSLAFWWVLSRALLNPIETLNEATRDIAAGNLALKVHVQTGDELEELANTFNEMTDALVKLRARAEDANPLTKLPGNRVIREEIEKRLAAKRQLTAIYADLDNFKAFNDEYGIGAGDDVLRLTAKVLKEAVKHGNPDDFLGHEGGDDFVMITTPDKADAVAHEVCTEFDQRIRAIYTPEDLARGGIISKDREGNTRKFPIMTFSLAGVTNAHRPLTSYAEVTNIFAEVKKRAKLTSKEAGRSCFVLDRRHGEVESPTPATPTPPQALPHSPPQPTGSA